MSKKVDQVEEEKLSLEKYLQTTGREINKYKKAYLVEHTKGSRRTKDEWNDFLATA